VKCADPTLAGEEIEKMTKCIEEVTAQHLGYVCKGQGGKFLIVFQTPTAAATFAAGLHAALLCVSWNPALASANPMCAARKDSDGALMSVGLRASIGICTGIPSMFDLNKTTHTMDYFGPVINRTARIMSVALPGETLLCGKTKTALEKKTQPAFEHIITSNGLFALKGVAEEQELFRFMPKTLAGRVTIHEEDKAALAEDLDANSILSPALSRAVDE
jgi:class 3 adenylate cyclase